MGSAVRLRYMKILRLIVGSPFIIFGVMLFGAGMIVMYVLDLLGIFDNDLVTMSRDYHS